MTLPFTDLRPGVAEAIGAAGHEVDPVYVGAGDSEYFWLLARLWAAGEDFCIVEHDIVVPPGALDELESCEQEWCALPYLYEGGPFYGMGCVRFRGSLTRRVPTAMEEVGTYSDDSHPRRHWCRLDAWLQMIVLVRHGEVRHPHAGVLGHLTEEVSHGCRR